jgi:O-antigen/teichoic acid export membrane protein
VGCELVGNVARLLGFLLLVSFSAMSVVAATIATLAAQGLSLLLMRRESSALFDPHAPRSPSVESEVQSAVRVFLPNVLFAILQANITTWVIAFVGGQGEIADLGALQRLAMVFAIAMTPLHSIASPALAKCRTRGELRRLVIRIAVPYFAFVGAAVLVAVAFAPWLVLLLGSGYAHVARDLPLAVLASGVGALASLAWTVVLSRGWIRLVWLNIPAVLIAQVLAGSRLSLGTVNGVLCLSLATQFVTLAVALAVGTREFRAMVVDQ